MPAAKPPSAVRRDLRAIVLDGAAFSVMVGAGQSYLQPFTLALGHSDVVGGLIATVPMVGGAFLQLAGPQLVVRLGSQKRWVVLASVVQALSWLPLAIGAWRGSLGVVALFALATVYWATGIGAGPAWTSWVETIVPVRLRARFMGRRQAICHAALFVSLVAAGRVLDVADAAGLSLRAFAWLFVASAVARLVSVTVLARQSEPVPLPHGVRHVGVLEVARRIPRERGLQRLFCVLPLIFACQMAEPFLAPYVLRGLRADYGTYLLLLAASFLGRIVALPFAGTLARRHGAARVLRWGVVGLVPVASLWVLSDSVAWLVAVQLAAGVAWGAFELGNFLVFFEAVPHRERTGVITCYFLATSLATVVGSLVGGQILAALDAERVGYVAVFVASTVARIAALRFVRPLRGA